MVIGARKGRGKQGVWTWLAEGRCSYTTDIPVKLYKDVLNKPDGGLEVGHHLVKHIVQANARYQPKKNLTFDRHIVSLMDGKSVPQIDEDLIAELKRQNAGLYVFQSTLMLKSEAMKVYCDDDEQSEPEILSDSGVE